MTARMDGKCTARIYDCSWPSHQRPPEGLHVVEAPLRYAVVSYDRPKECDKVVYYATHAKRIWKEHLDPQVQRGDGCSTRRPFGGSEDLLLTNKFLQEQILEYALGTINQSTLRLNIVDATVTQATGELVKCPSPFSSLMRQRSMGDMVATATMSTTLGQMVDQAMRDVHFGALGKLPEEYKLPQCAMGEVLGGPIGKYLLGTRASSITIKNGCISLHSATITELGMQEWVLQRIVDAAAELRRAFRDTEMKDPHAVSRLLNGFSGRQIDVNVKYVVAKAILATGASSAQLGGNEVVLPPCMTRERAKADRMNFNNDARVAYALVFVDLIRTTRTNKHVMMSIVQQSLRRANVPSHQIKELEESIKWAEGRAVSRARCSSRTCIEMLQCPFKDQMECNGGDPEATPVSMVLALSQATKSKQHVDVAYEEPPPSAKRQKLDPGAK